MVKIYEVTKVQENEDLGFDLIDDTSVWMKNDPQFYRHDYYPAMRKIADMHRDGKKINHRKQLTPMITKGIDTYCSKYDLGASSEDVFTQEDRDTLIDKIFSECMDDVKNGDYK